MALYTLLSNLCLMMFLCGAGYVLKRLFNPIRKERVEFVRSFKSGQCVFILIPTFLVVAMGLCYGDLSLKSILRAIPLSMKFVVMGFEFKELEPLMDADSYYALAVYLDCLFIVFNASMVMVSLFKQKVHYAVVDRRFLTTRKDIVLIAGLSKGNKAIYSSAPKNAERFIFCPLSREERNKLYEDGIEFLTLPEEKVLERICSVIHENSERDDADNTGSSGEENASPKAENSPALNTQACDIFINTGDDSKNLAVANVILGEIQEMKRESRLVYNRLSVYIFGSSRKKALFTSLEEKGFGCIHYVDEYRLAVLDLIENHPMASFFAPRHINSDTTLKDIKLKVFLIGFGRTNTELFLESVSNDQFVTKNEDGNPLHKSIDYYLFDRKKILENSNINYSYNRYKAFLKLRKKEIEEGKFLDPAPLPAVENLIPMQDIDSKTFFHNLRDNLAYGKDDINFISVSLNNDMDSIDLGNKIASKCREWGLENTHVAVRIRNAGAAGNIASDDILLWGDLMTSVYNYDAITRKKLERMAMIYDYVYGKYNREDGKKVELPIPVEYEHFEKPKVQRTWYEERNRIQRESSFNVCLNMKTKLYLIGVKWDEKTTYEDVKKRISSLSPRERENMARQEHYRWNAHYIASGFVPVSIEDIKSLPDYGKNPKKRMHPNLIEFDALKEYTRMTGKEVIKYDYEAVDLLADSFRILSGKGEDTTPPSAVC